MTKKQVNRRHFLKSTAAGASGLALTASSYAKVVGANDKLRIGFLGVGGRCQQHLDVILQMVKEGKAVVPVAVCDVWDGNSELGSGKGRGLYPSAKRCGVDPNDSQRCTKDYRRVLDLKDVDAVAVAAAEDDELPDPPQPASAPDAASTAIVRMSPNCFDMRRILLVLLACCVL